MTRAKNMITINGKVYDAISGLPLAAPDPVKRPTQPSTAHPAAPVSKTASSTPKPHVPAKAVHRTTQKSQTLRRQALKRPAPKHVDSLRRKPQPGHVSTSPHISKFAPHPQLIPKKPAAPAHVAKAPVVAQRVLSPQPVRHAVRPHQAASTPLHKPSPAALSSRELKQQLIAERLASVDTQEKHREHKAPRRSLFPTTPRVSSVLVASFAVIILGGYLTYINMPNLSMRVAAASSGVDGSFPEYKPDGYRLNGPIAYSTGEITVSFASNSNDSAYTIKQKSSNWDSQAVLDNYVSKKSDSFDTTSQQGLTIYTYDNSAAWVNSGTFYTIEGDAPLSNTQILRIAGSL